MEHEARDLSVGAATPTKAASAEWLDHFMRQRGRPLRVLHIGNIANNAYLNAKIQRRAGIEADVVAYDYYHVMGCPEWEDADFVGDVGDDSFPDWWAVDLRGFKRPSWFAQGRMASCERYLLARRQGRRLHAAGAWWLLRAEAWLRCRRSIPARVARRGVREVLPRARHLRAHLRGRRVIRGGRRVIRAALVRVAPAWRARPAWTRMGSKAADRAPASATKAPSRPTPGSVASDSPSPAMLLHRRLTDAYQRHFPDREDLLPEDYSMFLSILESWRELMSHYDVVQAYSTDPLLPLLCGVPYIAYEHGTIREIPFEADWRGRLCALSYAEAAAVCVTNIDNVASAHRLGIPGNRIVRLPHAVDSEKLRQFADANPEMKPPASVVRIFSPSRQDWVDGDPSWTKGNDRLLRAFRRIVDAGSDCRLTLVEWGRDVEASRQLIRELDLDSHVEWIPTLRKNALWLEYLRSHAIADQFVLPAFGGVTFEALALGRRVITSLDVALADDFFGAAPPLLVANNDAQIERALLKVVEDPADSEGLGAAAARWFFRYHSSERILTLELDEYRRIVG